MRTLRKEFIVCVFFLTTIRWREITEMRGGRSDCLAKGGKETILLDHHTPAGQIELPLHHRGPPGFLFSAICSVSRATDQPIENFPGRSQVAVPRPLNQTFDNDSQVIFRDRFKYQCTEMSHSLGMRVTRSAGIAGREAALCVTLTV